jgi:hypothetical protein
MADLRDQTPVEIDTALAALYEQMYRLMAARDRAAVSVRQAAGAQRIYRYGRGSQTWSMSLSESLDKARAVVSGGGMAYEVGQAQRALDSFEKATKGLAENEAEQNVFHEEFDRRGGWTRAFLVTNVNGHVHRSMNCSTCHMTTQFQWMVAYSDHAEAEIVEAAGWRACTVCYPTAPVNAFTSEKAAQGALPTKMFSKSDEEKAKARQEREDAKAAREAKRKANAPTLSGEPLTVVRERGIAPDHWKNAGQEYTREETFQTERSAMIWAVQELAWTVYSTYRPHAAAEGVQVVAEKIAEKRGVDTQVVLDEINIKAKKKAEKGG